ncbi:ABC transporter permease [Virgibacillus sp. Bac330]|uniref:ABC transporter permease n=1 Tax=Virgibacillus sp. Bac330 TaxID=2419841 RepID=UPI000EF4C65B|nr:ABC transporter permease [Virgibacillus sp. Bac330]
MNNKYVAYTYLSIKTLIINKSLVFGFLFYLIIACIAALYIVIFKPDFPTIDVTSIANATKALGAVHVIILVVIFFLFSTVSIMMQSVIDDRDSKVTEIINTSVSESHYLVGKLLTSFTLMFVTMLSAFTAICIASGIFSVFNPYAVSVYEALIQPIIAILDWEVVGFIVGCIFVVLVMLFTSSLLALGISIKAKQAVDAFPVSLMVLTPYFLLFGLFVFLPKDNMELWQTIASWMSFIPIASPIFILLYVLLNGFSPFAYIAILVSIGYFLVLFKGVVNIYRYAFYVREKLSLFELVRLFRNKHSKYGH